jgi:hypothetical protein
VASLKIHIGSDRIVLIVPSLRLAIKIPLFHFIEATKPFFSRGPSVKMLKYLKHYISWPIEVYGSFRRYIFNGLVSNWNEFILYQETHSPFIQPTYFSLFGLINIQLYGDPCQLQDVDLWCQLYGLTNGEVFDDSHHFANHHNFCFHNGILRMIDYGSRQSHGVIIKYGKKITKNFDPSYSWENEKMRRRAEQELTK